MKELTAQIRFLRFMKVAVVLVGLLMVFLIIKPAITESREKEANGIHLDGEVYTAKDFGVAIQPVTLFYDKWDADGGDESGFVNNGHHFKHGLGWYIPSDMLEVDTIGNTQLGFWFGQQFDNVYFKLCTDTNRTTGYGAGVYRIICYSDGLVVYDTEFVDCYYSDEVELNVSGVENFVIELQESRGIDGTLSVILGDFQVNKLSE